MGNKKAEEPGYFLRLASSFVVPLLVNMDVWTVSWEQKEALIHPRRNHPVLRNHERCRVEVASRGCGFHGA